MLKHLTQSIARACKSGPEKFVENIKSPPTSEVASAGISSVALPLSVPSVNPNSDAFSNYYESEPASDLLSTEKLVFEQSLSSSNTNKIK